MIRTFKCKRTKLLFEDMRIRQFISIESAARRKLAMLDAVGGLDDLKIPPANRLEALKGNRKGQHSIRINKQWRLCFRWQDGAAWEVEIVDYH